MRAFPVLAFLSVLLPALGGQAQELAPEDGNGDWRPRLATLRDANAAGGRLEAPMQVCRDTACAGIDHITLSAEEAEAVRAPLGVAAPDPAAERAALSQAIARFEGFVGARNGTWADKPRNLHDEDEAGQMDCVDEAANTITLLDRLTAEGRMIHHRVEGLAIRYLVMLQHVAVEIAETVGDERWVVDSWVGANGAEPEIRPWLDWRLDWSI